MTSDATTICVNCGTPIRLVAGEFGALFWEHVEECPENTPCYDGNRGPTPDWDNPAGQIVHVINGANDGDTLLIKVEARNDKGTSARSEWITVDRNTLIRIATATLSVA